MLPDESHGTPSDPAPEAPVSGEQLARQEAIKQIERRRHFWMSTAGWSIVMILVAVVWATSEYHNAGGWPTHGFSESSGIPNVWNYWIIYPFAVLVLGTAARAWQVFGRKPISEDEIKREMERQSGRH